ncbi:hypothetical protein EGR_10129 [Echinococcus granulosus]|uniref:Uncharacterized protein n=1 Tax=Echinococcus granulosus TaxID=6210 RepID=W6U394_ECHGR|nr:hypothetical protein EGR_10129 [Echinococcus granulosus]EUB55011.1 hypothetical protein EGR_10129 [Echinococcus granulosus]
MPTINNLSVRIDWLMKSRATCPFTTLTRVLANSTDATITSTHSSHSPLTSASSTSLNNGLGITAHRLNHHSASDPYSLSLPAKADKAPTKCKSVRMHIACFDVSYFGVKAAQKSPKV